MADFLITATEDTELSRNHARSLSKINPMLGSVASDQLQAVQFFVGLYSINKRRMAESNLAFLVENGAYKTVAIPTCPSDKRYIKVLDIPHPVQWIEGDPHNPGEVVVRTEKAKRVAMSIVHPDIIGESMDHLPSQSTIAKVAISSNCDLVRQGVFFTTEEEGSEGFLKILKASESRLDTYYRGILDGTQGMSEEQVRHVLGSERGLDLRMAAEHFGEDHPWMRRRKPMIDCPNCFDKIPQGAAFHKNELLGVMCILDWKRAVQAGVKKKEDVPDELRWWEEKPAAATSIDAELELMTKQQLIEFGTSFNLQLNDRQTKPELIDAIRKAAK